MSEQICMINLQDGDLLNESDGIVLNDGLKVNIIFTADKTHKYKVNDTDAVLQNDQFSAFITLDRYENHILIKDETMHQTKNLILYWTKKCFRKYRLSFDDNIWFLRDIAFNSYKSIFENPYLKFIKSIHDQFDTKIHINIYYYTPFNFNISQMPDRYKGEWRDNSDWLKLSFHANQDEPENPYKYSSPAEVLHDFDKVMNEIIRFAGYEVLMPVTTIHYSEMTKESCRALRQNGIKGLVGDFNENDGNPTVAYYLDSKQTKHMNERYAWKDTSEDILFVKSSIILNLYQPDQIVKYLEDLYKNPHISAYLDLLIHEQYFYPFYSSYQKNYREKVYTAIKWTVEHGYKTSFISECMFD